MTVGEKVAWNLLGWGSEEGYHPVHFHGQTLRYQSAKQVFKGDVFEVNHKSHIEITELLSQPYLVARAEKSIGSFVVM